MRTLRVVDSLRPAPLRRVDGGLGGATRTRARCKRRKARHVHVRRKGERQEAGRRAPRARRARSGGSPRCGSDRAGCRRGCRIRLRHGRSGVGRGRRRREGGLRLGAGDRLGIDRALRCGTGLGIDRALRFGTGLGSDRPLRFRTGLRSDRPLRFRTGLRSDRPLRFRTGLRGRPAPPIQDWAQERPAPPIQDSGSGATGPSDSRLGSGAAGLTALPGPLTVFSADGSDDVVSPAVGVEPAAVALEACAHASARPKRTATSAARRRASGSQHRNGSMLRCRVPARLDPPWPVTSRKSEVKRQT